MLCSAVYTYNNESMMGVYKTLATLHVTFYFIYLKVVISRNRRYIH